MERILLRSECGGQVSGRVFTSASDANDATKGRPLIVTIHGGTYSSSYFEADNSIINICEALKIPIVAIDRPGYGDSKYPPDQESNETFIQQQASFLHEKILPEIWKLYGGEETKTTSIVLFAHSIGGAVGTMIAALHARDAQKKYPLSGMVTSGLGVEYDAAFATRISEKRTPDAANQSVEWPPDMKNYLLLSADMGLCSNEMVAKHASLNHSITLAEIEDITDVGKVGWLSYWKIFAADVKVPHLNASGQDDRLWHVTEQNMASFAKAYSSCPRMQSFIVPWAPHNIELSFQGEAWLTRSFGFAMECAVAAGIEKGRN